MPFRIRWDEQRKERPQVVMLCDVSDSVRNVSRFMLQFVHSLQDMYSRVRCYVFVADIAEVTQLFKDNDIQTAIHEGHQRRRRQRLRALGFRQGLQASSTATHIEA